MIGKINKKYYPIILIILLLFIITMAGASSFDTTKSFFITNQYGHQVELFGIVFSLASLIPWYIFSIMISREFFKKSR